LDVEDSSDLASVGSDACARGFDEDAGRRGGRNEYDVSLGGDAKRRGKRRRIRKRT